MPEECIEDVKPTVANDGPTEPCSIWTQNDVFLPTDTKCTDAYEIKEIMRSIAASEEKVVCEYFKRAIEPEPMSSVEVLRCLSAELANARLLKESPDVKFGQVVSQVLRNLNELGDDPDVRKYVTQIVAHFYPDHFVTHKKQSKETP